MVRLITLGRLQLLRDGLPREEVHLQPKRLALLAFLALAARDGAQRRDTLLGLFWPNADRERARRCLRQALFHLRNELGDGAIVGAGREGVALAPGRLWCDAAAMEEALSGGRWREALSLYGGDFLPGLFVDGCDAGLDEWVEGMRGHLRDRAVAGAWELAERELQEQRVEAALETARRARSLAPDNELGLRRHMALLARVGDPAAALGTYAEFARRLLREYEAKPSLETRALAADLKHGLYLARSVSAAPLPAAGAAPGPAEPSVVQRAQRRRSTDAGVEVRRSAVIAMLLVGGLALGELLVARPGPPVGGHLLLAEFTNHTRDSLLGVAVTEALRADLSQIAEVRLAGAGQEVPAGTERTPQDSAVALVTGDVAALGPGFTVSVRLLAPGSGRVLAVIREDAAESKVLLEAVERLSRRLRGNVIQSLASAGGEALGGPR